MQRSHVEPEIIPATLLRLHTRDLMERVKFKGERFLVETFGRPMVVLISYEDLLRIRDYLAKSVPSTIEPVPTLSFEKANSRKRKGGSAPVESADSKPDGYEAGNMRDSVAHPEDWRLH